MDNSLAVRVRNQAWFQRFPRALPVGLFTIIYAMTLLAVFAIERVNDRARLIELDRTATEITSALQQRAATNIAYLRAGAALFETTQNDDLPVFSDFVKRLHIDKNSPGAQSLGWAMKVLPADIDKARIPGTYAQIPIWPRPGPDQPFSIPVTYLAPETAITARARGFDMYSEPRRRQAMDRAAHLDVPVASGKVILKQENGVNVQAGFLIYMPVFKFDETGRNSLRGYVYSAFRAQDFLNSASDIYNASGMGIELYDLERRPESLLAAIPLNAEAGSSIEKEMALGERAWTLRVTAPQSQSLSQLSRATLLFGSIVALLQLAISWLITKRASADQQALDWQRQQSAIRNSLTRELNHRVKNTLANVLSIIALTKRRAIDLDDYVDKLTGRVRALSATHDLLTKSEWGSTLIREVVEAELAPYSEASDNHIVMAGPEISLAPNDALSLGLVIHELATNAAKYGALSAIDGIVHVDWHMQGADMAEIIWCEAGGPAVSVPEKRGFGRDLIEKVVAHELKAEVDLQFHESGVQCRLSVPVRKHTQFALRAGPLSGLRDQSV